MNRPFFIAVAISVLVVLLVISHSIGYDSGYAAGYDHGSDIGYDAGYNSGYEKGKKSASANSRPSTPQITVPAITAPRQTKTVYVTETGSKYHSYGCRYLKDSCFPMSLSDAKANGYTPCSVCKP